jgi:hypothetical protein
MQQNLTRVKRTWRTISIELVTETNPKQFRRLARELETAIETHNRTLCHHSRWGKPSKSRPRVH